jgi:hypothetical protein
MREEFCSGTAGQHRAVGELMREIIAIAGEQPDVEVAINAMLNALALTISQFTEDPSSNADRLANHLRAVVKKNAGLKRHAWSTAFSTPH